MTGKSSGKTDQNADVPKKRLTQDDRKTIAHAIVKPRIDAEIRALKERALVLADEVYDVMYSKEEQRLMATAPARAFATNDIKPYTSYGHANLLVQKRVFASDRHNRPDITTAKHPDLAAKLHAFIQDEKSIEKKETDENTALIAALSNFLTWRALADGWPELWQSIKHLCPKDTASTALAIPFDQLNTRFGLTRLEEAA